MAQNWEPIGCTIQSLAQRFRELGSAPEPQWQVMPAKDLATAMRMAEAIERLRCDALLRAALIPNGGFGQPTSRQSFFCVMRCLCALDTLGIIHAELDDRPLYPTPPSDWSDEALLGWLLIANWQQRHDTWLKLSAFSVASGLGLYSG